jgi:DNA-directed RNA polymerase subunit RPC12/RpoP
MEQTRFPCEACGASLQFAPGTASLKCPYCGHENKISQAEAAIEELDYHAALAELVKAQPVLESITVKCGNCAAEFTLDPVIRSADCPFCGTPVVLEDTHKSVILKPQSLLAFALTDQQARERFAAWLQSLWFAPNKVKHYARQGGGLTGMYIPYWTFDCSTTSSYTGQRGEYYYVTETYTEEENGRPVQRTRQVRRTNWYPASGTVWRDFDDVLALASNSLPRSQTEHLEPWDLENLVPYSEQYLSGFRTEAYQVDVQQGFERAKDLMAVQINEDIRQDIGGDEQRIHGVQTRHDHITCKHILLPIYLAAYRVGDKSYRFVVNGRTGEVQGERPYSWIKITTAVLVAIAVLTIIMTVAGQHQ